MRRRTLGVLPSYDIISKSIPGVVFLLLLVSLVPSKYDFEAISFGDSLADYALIFIASLLLALFVGEGIHITAIFIEQTLLFVARVILGSMYRFVVVWKIVVFIISTIAQYLSRRLQPLVEDYWPDVDTPSLSGDRSEQVLRVVGWVVSMLAKRLSVFRRWVARRYWGLHDTFKNHRVLFVHSLLWHMDKTDERKQTVGDRWDEVGKGVPYDCFGHCLESDLGINLNVPETDESDIESELESLYTHVKTRTAAEDIGQSSRFQAIYSFCRSMYVVSLFAVLAYGIATFPSVLGSSELAGVFRVFGVTLPADSSQPWYEPASFQYLSENTNITLFVPAISTVVFMVGTGRYKRHFVDYLIAEYFILISSAAGSAFEGSSEGPERDSWEPGPQTPERNNNTPEEK